MVNVTGRVKAVKQPHGGYLPARTLTQEVFDDGGELHEKEDVHPTLIGTVVDHLFRYSQPESDVVDVFSLSLSSALAGGFQNYAMSILDVMSKDIDESTVRGALALTRYNGIGWGTLDPSDGDPARAAIPSNDETISNIQRMVERTRAFFEREGGVAKDTFVFGDAMSRTHSGYTEVVTHGDGDILTPNGMWDIKVSKNKPTSKNTLQLLMYYLMGQRAFMSGGEPMYDGLYHRLETIGFFNPRLNASFSIDVADLDEEMLREVDREVIGYTAPRPVVTEQSGVGYLIDGVGYRDYWDAGDDGPVHKYELT